DDADGVARRLMKTNRRLAEDQAQWLARHWARQEADGKWHILGDAAHKIINASLFRVDEVLESYRAIRCPVLAVEASDDSLGQWWQGRYTLAEYHERLKAVSDMRIALIEDAGHMLHHDQPAALAKLIEDFHPLCWKALRPPGLIGARFREFFFPGNAAQRFVGGKPCRRRRPTP